MEEVKKKTTKKITNASKVQKVSKKKIEASNLSNDELLEQILAKKKQKNSTKDINVNKDTKKSSVKAKNTNLDKRKASELSSDELYDLIKSKKKSKKKSVDTEKNDSIIDTEIKKEEAETSKSDESKKQEDNLIITREITFTEESLDLKDKRLLKELRDAIQEFDSLDDSFVKDEKSEEEIVKTRKVDKFNFNYKLIGYIILSLVALLMIVVFFIKSKDATLDENTTFNNTKEEDVIDLRPQLYDECLKSLASDSNKSSEILEAEDNLTNYLKENYDVSVIYEDLNIGFTYSYNSDVVYYGASLIKALDGLYIYTKASEGEINLDDTMVYSSKYKWSSSREMSKYKYGDEVTIRDLVKYAITVSDNTAHQMLISYIGRSNLKEFGNSLGAKNTLSGTSDNFGNITAIDALIYVKAINKFINENEELGNELKSYFVAADQNGLDFPEQGIQAAHKYGEYKYYYHDIGIVYDNKPYAVTIMTLEGNRDFVDKVRDINNHIYELHNLYYSNREKSCRLEVYGE